MLVMYAVVLYVSFFMLLTLLELDSVTEGVEYPETFPSLAVIVPAYNEEETIEITLDSLIESEYPDKEIIVVNDGSTDRTEEKVKPYVEEHSYINLISQENQGKGAALNTALESTEAELVACVDADSQVTGSSLKNIVAEMDDDAAGIASAMQVRNPSNTLQDIQQIEYMVNVLSRKIMGVLEAIHVTPGALSVYNREKLEEVGGFDEDSIVEDQEICWRFQKGHEKIQHSRNGETYTEAPDNLKDFYRQRRRWWTGSLECLIDYRKVMFNPRYGDFGMFIVPSNLFTPLVAVMALLLVGYLTVTPFISTAQNIAILGLDAISVSLEFEPEAVFNWIYWHIFANNFVLLSALGSLTLFSLSVVYLAAVHTRQSLKEVGKLGAAIYIFYFFLFNGFMTLVAVKNVALSSNIEW